MNILEEIIQYKYKEVSERKVLYPINLLEQSIYFQSPVVSLKRYVQRKDKSGIIAEIKRRSPSKGVINKDVSVEKVSTGYARAGASALSVLTDSKYFGGSNEDLLIARKLNSCPILRKDFVVDEYQIIEAKSIGADAILLIAAALGPAQIKTLSGAARSLNLEILLEVHNENELQDNLGSDVDLIGVNNRDLKTFITDIELSKKLADKIPDEFVKISESGIESVETIMELKNYGFEGFLMGQNFMQHNKPEEACQTFINQLRKADTK